MEKKDEVKNLQLETEFKPEINLLCQTWPANQT